MTILDVMRDPALLGPRFRERASWRAWEAFLAALFGLPMDDEAAALYRRHTGRTTPPTDPAQNGSWGTFVVLTFPSGLNGFRKLLEQRANVEQEIWRARFSLRACETGEIYNVNIVVVKVCRLRQTKGPSLPSGGPFRNAHWPPLPCRSDDYQCPALSYLQDYSGPHFAGQL